MSTQAKEVPAARVRISRGLALDFRYLAKRRDINPREDLEAYMRRRIDEWRDEEEKA